MSTKENIKIMKKSFKIPSYYKKRHKDLFINVPKDNLVVAKRDKIKGVYFKVPAVL